MSPEMSVVIPAHNEERVLPRLLASLADARLEIIVVANGCSDATADVARAAGVRVIELAEGSKVAALDAGDDAASLFPRAYVDADIEIDARDLLAVADRLRDGPELVASPRLRLDLSGATWPVRAYYAVWDVSSFRRRGHIGSGVYVLSAGGRRRFGTFPPVIGDDRFVQGLFGPAERPPSPTRSSSCGPRAPWEPCSPAAPGLRRETANCSGRDWPDTPRPVAHRWGSSSALSPCAPLCGARS